MILLAAAALARVQEGGGHAVRLRGQPFEQLAENRPRLLNLSLEELMQLEVVTASRVPEALGKSPLSVSVITAEDIQRLGARSLSDVLRIVPGVGVTNDASGLAVLSVRGIRKTATDNVLVKLNGHVLNDPSTSSAVFLGRWDLPLHNVERIEVVRGPSSALYGANAFMAVINVITKQPQSANGVEIGLSHEFEDTGSVGQEYSLLFGRQNDQGQGFTLNLNVLDLSGPDLLVASDLFGRSGRADSARQRIDVQASLNLGRVRLATRYYDRTSGGFFGSRGVLNDETVLGSESGYLEIQAPFDLDEHTKLSLTAYVDHIVQKQHFVVLPAGTIPPHHPNSAWNPTGLVDNFRYKNTWAGAQVDGTFTNLGAHTLVAGLGVEYQSQHAVRRISNDGGTGVPLPEPVDVSATFNFNQDAERDVIALYLEDVWNVTPKLRLSSSVRYDRYSDFGGSLNPRLGLAWDFAPRFDLKFVYGTAFHAPGFGFLFLINNSRVLGNPDLEAEKIRTFEASFGASPASWLSLRLTYFHNDLDDLIARQPLSPQLDNLDEATSHGFETELRVQTNRFNVSLNHTYVDSSFDATSQLSEVPSSRGSLVADFPFGDHVNLNLSLYWQGETGRSVVDPRRDLPAYTLLNTTLLLAEIRQHLDLHLSVQNLLDEDYAYPSRAREYPQDFTAPGRSVVLGLRHRF